MFDKSKLPNPSDQNLAIIKAWEEAPTPHLMVDAYAGTGKTTQLKLLAGSMVQHRRLSTLVLAFNKKNATELETVLPDYFTCSTLNSVGHRALAGSMRVPGGLRVEEKKVGQIVTAVGEQWGYGKLKGDDWLNPITMVRWAKVSGLMHNEYVAKGWKSLIPDSDETWEELADAAFIDLGGGSEKLQFIREVLRLSIQLGTQGTIDYDDQIYLSVLGPAAYTKYQVVMVDESQDLSRLNHLQLKKSLALGGRLVVVGDPKQAIYAFRGASTKSMGEITELWGKPEQFTRLPLSLTYRCPQVVVARQQSHVPGYTAHSSNLKGEVIDLRRAESWSIEDLPDHRRFAILCRNTAPLLSAAFRLIASGRGVSMLGRELGKSLISLLDKITGKKNLPLKEAIEAVQKWRQTEVSLALANGKEEKVSQINDRADCLCAVAEFSGLSPMSSEGMKKAIIALFEDQSGNITLGTGHRSKGMEWPMVIHLDPWRIPSKFAKSAEEDGNPDPMEQELNLRYVIETRTQACLVLANLKEFQP